MKKFNYSPAGLSPRTRAARRAQLLEAYARSGLSVAEFARRHGLNCTTFYGWRSRQAKKTLRSPGFVEVELPALTGRSEVIIELGASARLRLEHPEQLDLVVRLLTKLKENSPC